MADQEQKPKVCPNCGPGTKTHAGKDNAIVCEQCGGTFTYVAGEAKVMAVGELDKVKADVEELKQRLPASVPAAATTDNPDQPTEEEEEEEDDDEEDQ